MQEGILEKFLKVRYILYKGNIYFNIKCTNYNNFQESDIFCHILLRSLVHKKYDLYFLIKRIL